MKLKRAANSFQKTSSAAATNATSAANGRSSAGSACRSPPSKRDGQAHSSTASGARK